MALQKLSPERLDTTTGIILTPASTPSAPVEGQMYYDSTADQVQFYNGSAWGLMGGGGVKDDDEDTYITAELSADVDALDFYTAGTARMHIINDGAVAIGKAATSFNSTGVSLECIDGLTISSTTTNPNIYLDNQTTNGKKWTFQAESGDGALTCKNVTDNNTAFQINTSGEFLGLTVSGTINLTTGNAFKINNTTVLDATTLSTYAPLAAPAFTGTATGVNLTLSGNLTVDGTTTTINSTTLTVDDKNIELGSVATPTDTTADGGGITLKGTTDKTITWVDANDAWSFNQGIKFTDGTSSLSGSFLQETTTTIEGTVSEQKLLMADSATLSGNLTVNDRLVLTQMQDDKYGLDAHVKLLIHSDTTDGSTTFTDSSRLGTHTITASGNTQHKTAQYKFGATSMYFDGTGDYLSIPDHADWDITSDFTIDCWVYRTASSGSFLSQVVDDSNKWIFGTVDDSGNDWFTFAARTGGSWELTYNADLAVDGAIYCPLNTWTHVAVSRSGNNWYLFSNGTLVSTASVDFDATFSAPLHIGYANTWNNLAGYIDEIRISKGVARWTESFTPPYKAYADSTPALLTGGYTITGSGTIENGLIDSTDQWEGSTYINTLGTVLEGELTGNVKFPAGHIIQVASDSNSTTGAGVSVTGSTGDTNTHGYQLFNTSFTPKYSNSKILIQTSNIFIGEESNVGNNCWLAAWYDTTKVASAYGTPHYLTVRDALGHTFLCLNHTFNSWGTSAKNINVRGGLDGAGYIKNRSTYALQSYAMTIGLTIMEIAQ